MTSRYSGYEQVQKNSLISYVLSDQVWWCNIQWFLSSSKNYTCKFMQAHLWHYKYSTSICPFESRKCGMEGKKLQSLNISRTKKAFLKKQKTFFIVFEGLSFDEKIKI